MNRRIKMKRMKRELEVLRNKPIHVQIVKDSRKVSKMIDDFNALGEKYLVPVASMYPTSAISVAGSFDSKYGCDYCRYKEKCIKEHRLLEIDYSYDIAQQTGPHPRYVLNPTCTCPLEEIDED